ncbi:MAG: hypothetical protein IH627_22285 [Rubrivivax sp.]|nr:hypothetical protein [Rubrivivax sp.]
MRTTIDIDADLLAAARALARREGRPTGEVVSRLLRRSLTGLDAPAAGVVPMPVRRVAGFEPFPALPGVVTTNDQVDAMRDGEAV